MTRQTLLILFVGAGLLSAAPVAADSSRSRPASPTARAQADPRPAPGWRTRAAAPTGRTAPTGAVLSPRTLAPRVRWGSWGHGVPLAPLIGAPQAAPAPVIVVVERQVAPVPAPRPEPRVIELPPPPPAPPPREGEGRVRVAVSPPEAVVMVDDAEVSAGDVLVLPAGVHSLRVRAPDGRSERLIFGVEPDREVRVEVDLGAESRDRTRIVEGLRIADP